MLESHDHRAIEAEAESRIRALWREADPQAVRSAVAEIRDRIESGSWWQQSFAAQVAEIAQSIRPQDARSPVQREEPDRPDRDAVQRGIEIAD